MIKLNQNRFTQRPCNNFRKDLHPEMSEYRLKAEKDMLLYFKYLKH